MSGPCCWFVRVSACRAADLQARELLCSSCTPSPNGRLQRLHHNTRGGFVGRDAVQRAAEVATDWAQ